MIAELFYNSVNHNSLILNYSITGGAFMDLEAEETHKLFDPWNNMVQ
jgi:hypothetical protein